MGERITFRKNERLHTINPRWRGNPIVKGSFSIVSIAGVQEWVVCLNGVFPQSAA